MPEEPRRIVLVDDAVDVRRVVGLQLLLSGSFTVVGEGSTGHEAVDLAHRLGPDFLLLDVSMPGMDGLEALGAVRRASPRTRIVVFTGFASPDLEERALALGADDFIEKSIAIEDLPRRLLDGRHRPAAPPRAAEPTELPGGRSDVLLAEHLERFRAVFDRATIGMATLTLSGGIVRANHALARLLGCTPENLVGRSFPSLVDPLRHAAFLDAMHDVITAREDSTDVEHLLRERPQMWVRSTVASVRDSHGNALYLLLQVEDITERRAAAEALRQSEERFRLLVEGVVDYAIFMLDPSGAIASWNTGAERIKGYRADEVLGQHLRIFYTQEAQALRHPEHELELAAANGRYEEEGWRVRKDGSRFWANVVLTALFDADHHLVGFAKVTRDITERRTAALERERASTELRHANHRLRAALQENADLVAVTAHELRSPIFAIDSAASILLEHSAAMSDEDRNETLGTIRSSSARLRRLLDDLLMMSRLDADAVHYAVEAIEVRDALADVVGSIDAQGRIEVRCPAGLKVLADYGRLVQILSNLLLNALVYGASPVTVAAGAGDGTVELRVIDHGQGVPDTHRSRLFTKFARIKGRQDRGTGLGLYIVRQLAQAQQGEAWYEQTPGGGATFVVRLPRA